MANDERAQYVKIPPPGPGVLVGTNWWGIKGLEALGFSSEDTQDFLYSIQWCPHFSTHSRRVVKMFLWRQPASCEESPSSWAGW